MYTPKGRSTGRWRVSSQFWLEKARAKFHTKPPSHTLSLTLTQPTHTLSQQQHIISTLSQIITLLPHTPPSLLNPPTTTSSPLTYHFRVQILHQNSRSLCHLHSNQHKSTPPSTSHTSKTSTSSPYTIIQPTFMTATAFHGSRTVDMLLVEQ